MIDEQKVDISASKVTNGSYQKFKGRTQYLQLYVT